MSLEHRQVQSQGKRRRGTAREAKQEAERLREEERLRHRRELDGMSVEDHRERQLQRAQEAEEQAAENEAVLQGRGEEQHRRRRRVFLQSESIDSSQRCCVIDFSQCCV